MMERGWTELIYGKLHTSEDKKYLKIHIIHEEYELVSRASIQRIRINENWCEIHTEKTFYRIETANMYGRTQQKDSIVEWWMTNSEETQLKVLERRVTVLEDKLELLVHALDLKGRKADKR